MKANMKFVIFLFIQGAKLCCFIMFFCCFLPVSQRGSHLYLVGKMAEPKAENEAACCYPCSKCDWGWHVVETHATRSGSHAWILSRLSEALLRRVYKAEIAEEKSITTSFGEKYFV